MYDNLISFIARGRQYRGAFRMGASYLRSLRRVGYVYIGCRRYVASYRYRGRLPLLSCIAFFIILLSLLALGKIASAQTPTPAATAYPTNTPWELGPTPTWGGPVGPVWICYGYREGPSTIAPICTWGDYFEFNLEAVSGEYNALVHDPARASEPVANPMIMAFIAPVGTSKLQVTCSTYATHFRISGSSGGSVASYYTTNPSVPGVTVEGGNLHTNGAVGEYLHTQTITFTAVSTLPSDLIFDSEDLIDYPRVQAHVSAAAARKFEGGMWVTYASFVQLRMACQVDKLRNAGVWYDPPTPVVGDATPTPGGPTPTPGGGLSGWPTLSAVAWSVTPWAVPVATHPATLGLVEGTPECTTLIPAFSWGPYTVLGYELAMSVTEYELCTTDTVVSLEWLGVNFGAYLAILAGIGGIGILYSRLK